MLSSSPPAEATEGARTNARDGEASITGGLLPPIFFVWEGVGGLSGAQHVGGRRRRASSLFPCYYYYGLLSFQFCCSLFSASCLGPFGWRTFVSRCECVVPSSHLPRLRAPDVRRGRTGFYEMTK